MLNRRQSRKQVEERGLWAVQHHDLLARLLEVGTVDVEWMTPDMFRSKLLKARWALQAWW
jgi:hypothetical protein